MSKGASSTARADGGWDELIACAEERLQHESRHAAELRALVRWLEGRRDAGEPAPRPAGRGGRRRPTRLRLV